MGPGVQGAQPQPAAPEGRGIRPVRPVSALWQQWDVVVALGLAALLWVASSLWPSAGGAWRVTLGLVVLLVVPGHLLVAALFPAVDDLDGLARVALALVLGAGLVILVPLGLAEAHWRLTAASAAGGVLAVSTACALVAAWRRQRLPAERRFVLPLPRGVGFWGVLTLAVALAVLTSSVVGGALHAQRVAFFVTGAAGHLEGYPYQVPVGTAYHLGLHVSDPTPRPFVGKLTATANGGKPFLEQSLRLPAGGRWAESVTLPAGPATGQEVVRFYLYRTGGATASRELWVRYTVVP